MPAHVFLQRLLPFFTLAAADDFADPWHQQIHRRDSFPVVVQTHVKWFDLLGKIENGNGTFETFFGQPALVLRLKVQAVIDRELKFLAALF